MIGPANLAVRCGGLADAEAIGQLLHDFNSEFDEPTPSPPELAERVREPLMETAIELARREGADHMDLGTSEDDVAARALYESLGFDNHEGRGKGPVAYFYEREL